MSKLGFGDVDFGNFWSTRDLRRNGVALDKESRVLYLFESKSHKNEITRGNVWKSSFSAKQKENYQKKCEAIKSTEKNDYGVNLDAY